MRLECRRELRELVRCVAGRGGPEPELHKMKTLQTRIGTMFLGLLESVGLKEEIKQEVQAEYEWLVSDDFIECFTDMWQEWQQFPG